jgi:hypothetical protein
MDAWCGQVVEDDTSTSGIPVGWFGTTPGVGLDPASTFAAMAGM